MFRSDLYSGCPLYDTDKMELYFYRYHIVDPVYFCEDIRVEAQQIGAVDETLATHCAELSYLKQTKGYSYPSVNGDFESDFLHLEQYPDINQGFPLLFERSDDWCSCAYFYLDSPTNDLPLLPLSARWV